VFFLARDCLVVTPPPAFEKITWASHKVSIVTCGIIFVIFLSFPYTAFLAIPWLPSHFFLGFNLIHYFWIELKRKLFWSVSDTTGEYRGHKETDANIAHRVYAPLATIACAA
jgi:hypothetical protein